MKEDLDDIAFTSSDPSRVYSSEQRFDGLGLIIDVSADFEHLSCQFLEDISQEALASCLTLVKLPNSSLIVRFLSAVSLQIA